MLPYSPEAYFGAIARMNAELAIFVVIAMLLGLFLLALTWWPSLADHKSPQAIDRRACLALAAGWLAAGAVFYGNFLAPLFFAAPWLTGAFAAQAALLFMLAVVRPPPRRHRGGTAGLAGRLLMLYALALVPLLDIAFGPGWPGVRFIGLAPEPTVAFTAGWLLTRHPDWRTAALALLTVGAGALIAYSAMAWAWLVDAPLAVAILGAALAAGASGLQNRRA